MRLKTLDDDGSHVAGDGPARHFHHFVDVRSLRFGRKRRLHGDVARALFSFTPEHRRAGDPMHLN
jgi:hypothetical protein